MRQMAGGWRRATAIAVPVRSLTETRAMSDRSFVGRARSHRGQRDHLHRVVAEADPLEGGAVDRAVVFAYPAVRAAVIVHQDLAPLSTELLAQDGVADLDEAAARSIAALAVDDHVQRLLRADVVAGAAEDAG